MYPTLSVTAESRTVTETFYGYNHTLQIGDGQFYDELNLTSDDAPVLSTRKGRGTYLSTGACTGAIGKSELCYTDGECFCMGSTRINLGLNSEPKQLVSMGAYTIILPDKKYVNTANLSEYGDIEASFESTGDVTFTLCRLDGTALVPDYTQAEEPETPSNGAIWLDTSGATRSLKQWSQSTNMWTSVVSTYVRVDAAGIGKDFAEYDAVNINIPEGAPDQAAALHGSNVIYGRGDDYIVIVGIISEVQTVTGTVTVDRKMPVMDYVVESNNRLWGCRYGIGNNGEFLNEIYASKLGDFKNWSCYLGVSTDSYTVSVGSDGPFTGAATHSGYPIFFKEHCMHKIYGSIPSSFQVQTTECRGVQAGCSRSLAIVNEVLYYKSQHGICAYDGSLPTEVSGVLGEVQYKNAVAGALGNKYYVAMEDTAGEKSVFCYDTGKSIWHKESGIDAQQMCAWSGELYCVTTDGNITAMTSGEEKNMPWMAQTGIWNVTTPERAYLKRINIRMVLEQGSTVRLAAQYDSRGAWEPLGQMRGANLQSFTFAVRPRRCDHLRLRISGTGKAMIFSIARVLSGGSDKP